MAVPDNPPAENRPKSIKIGVTGASGFVGTRLIDGVNRVGQRVVAFSRDTSRHVVGCIDTRLFSLDKPLKLDDCEAFVHLAGESVFGYWTESKKRRILDSRVKGTRHVVESIAAAKKKPKVLICASGIGFYGDSGDTELDETSPAGSGFLVDVCQEWEREALRAEEHGVRTVVLRIGLVIGKNGGVMSVMRPIFMLGLGAQMGSGQQWMSWVHVADVAGLTMFAIENQTLRGVVNAVSPTPSRNADFTKALGRKFNRPVFFTIPEWILKKALGELSSLVLGSQRVLPRRALEAGYKFHYTKL